MLMWVFAIIIYVFFIYGLFQFFLNTYNGFGRNITSQRIQVFANKENIEYLIRTLKHNFTDIVIILEERDKEAKYIAETLGEDINIEIKTLEEISKIKKSL